MNLISFTQKTIFRLIYLAIRLAIYGTCFVLLAWWLLDITPDEQRVRATQNIYRLLQYTRTQSASLSQKSGIDGSLLKTTLTPTQKVLNGEDPYADVNEKLFERVDRDMDRKNAPSRAEEHRTSTTPPEVQPAAATY